MQSCLFFIWEGMIIFFQNLSCFILFNFVFTKKKEKKKANLSSSAVFELALGLFFLEEMMQLLQGTCLSPSQGGDMAPSRMYLQ